MASNAPNFCEICDLTFNEDDRCPRTLPCAHCVCNNCVGQLINRNQKTCPFCRAPFQANSAKDLGVNRYLLDVLKYVEEMEKSNRSPVKEKKSFTSMAKEYREDYKEANRMHISECLNNISDIENKLKKHNGMYGELSQLKKHVASTFNKVETKIDGLMMRIEVEKDALSNKLKEVKDQEKRLRSLDNKLLSVSSSVKDDVALMEETEKANVRMQQLLRDWEDFLTKQEKLQDNIKKVTEKTVNQISRIEELLNSEEEEAEQEIELLASSEIFTIDDLRSMDEPLRRMIQEDGIYAVQHFEGNKRYARITQSQEDGNILCLHHLQEVQHLPPNVSLIPFDKVMNVDDSSSSSRIAFLELGDGKRSLGKLFIKLINHSNYSLNFSYLCTGEKGPSYVNSCLFDVGNKGNDYECVFMGDYEKNNHSGGKAVVPGVDWEKEYRRDIHKRTSSIEKGLVKACSAYASNVSQFNINTRDRPPFKEGIFGIVVKGLDVLSEAINNYSNIKEVKIIDSGIILSKDISFKKDEYNYPFSMPLFFIEWEIIIPVILLTFYLFAYSLL